VRYWAELTGAARIEVVSASDDARLIGEALAEGEILPAGEGRYYSRSYIKDTARAEERTVVATSNPADQGVFNNWRPAGQMRPLLEERMRGRRRPHAPSAGPAGPGPRAADRGVPPWLVLQAIPLCDGASVHVVPSREASWSQSAVVALGLGVSVVGTAVDGLARTLGNGRGVLVPPDHPHALAAALSRVLADCCWNTTTSAPAPSTRCGWSPMTRSWCWG
jgi:glycosyltransferase involved in cell wall biosynthesis